jgi:hypothetical protein
VLPGRCATRLDATKVGLDKSVNNKIAPLIVSLHMPKTAGNSFKAVLDEHFEAALKNDYADYPINVTPQERHRQAVAGCLAATVEEYSEIRCIHGHFLPIKYLLLADMRPTVFVAWMREPLARLVSHYHYWYDAYNPASPDTRPLHRRVVEEQWSLEKFCLSSDMRNLYSQYLWGFPLERFDFIGITEDYERDLRAFSLGYLGSELQVRLVNQRKSPPASGIEELTGRLRSRVEKWHAADIELYQRALAASATRSIKDGRVVASGLI